MDEKSKLKVELFFNQKQGRTNCRVLEGNADIPINFVSDGASIPRALWGWCNPLDAKYLQCFVRHDYRYVAHTCTREQADRELLEGLQKAGMRFSQRWAIYLAVRAFGGYYWS